MTNRRQFSGPPEQHLAFQPRRSLAPVLSGLPQYGLCQLRHSDGGMAASVTRRRMRNASCTSPITRASSGLVAARTVKNNAFEDVALAIFSIHREGSSRLTIDDNPGRKSAAVAVGGVAC